MHRTSFVVSLSSLLLVSASLDCFSFFRWSHTALAQGPTRLKVSTHPMSHAHVSSRWVLLLISSTSPLTSPSSSSLWSPCSSFCPTTSTSTMWWTNTLRTSAEDLSTLAENEPPKGNESNDHFITEAYVRDQSNKYDLGCDAWTPHRRFLKISMETETYQARGLDSHESLCWEKNIQIGIQGRVGDWQRNKQHQGVITCGQKCGKRCLTQRNEKENKNGLSRNRSLTMLEDFAVFTSLIQRMRRSSAKWRIFVESWKIPMPSAMPCRLQRCP